jgi:alpha-L-arabinofuranosidase
MSCFAPLFVNVNPGGMQWKSDLIGYDALHSFGSPSYHVQKMFSNNLGDQVVNVEAKDLPTQIKPPSRRDSAAGIGPKTIPAMFFSATRDSKAGMIYLKIVNAAATPQTLKVDLVGPVNLKPQGKAITISAGSPEDTNSITEPDKIVPVTTGVKGLGKHFQQTVPAQSVTVLQLQIK